MQISTQTTTKEKNILEQTKVAEYGADYVERAGQVSGTTWKNDKFPLRENF